MVCTNALNRPQACATRQHTGVQGWKAAERPGLSVGMYVTDTDKRLTICRYASISISGRYIYFLGSRLTRYLERSDKLPRQR